MIAIRILCVVDRALSELERAAVTVALLIMVLLSFAQVALRNAHIEALPPVPWIHSVTQHLVLWVAMLGAALAASGRRHISIEFLSKAVSPHGRRVVESLVDLATIVVCVVLSFASWRYITYLEWPEASKSVILSIGGTKILAWWSYTIMPVGFGLVAFHYLRLLVERIFVDEPVADERAVEIEEYDRAHPSGERDGAATGPGAAPASSAPAAEAAS